MLMVDVNVCVYAFRRESRMHAEFKGWLEQALSGSEPVGLPEQVLSSAIRLVTNHRIYGDPSTPAEALSFCDALLDAPAAMRVRPGERHWRTPVFQFQLGAGSDRPNHATGPGCVTTVDRQRGWLCRCAAFWSGYPAVGGRPPVY